MTLHLRQICLVTDQIQTATRDLIKVFSLKTCFIDDGVAKFGLQNVLMPIGRDFLEVVAPTQPETYAERYMKRRGGEGGYMVICQVRTKSEQDAHRHRAIDADVRVAWESDGPTWRYVQCHPGDMMGTFLTVDYDSAESFNGPCTGWRRWLARQGFNGCDRTHDSGRTARPGSRGYGEPLEPRNRYRRGQTAGHALFIAGQCRFAVCAGRRRARPWFGCAPPGGDGSGTVTPAGAGKRRRVIR